MATVIPGGFLSQASPTQQNIGAQLAASRETGIAQARQASAQFLEDAKMQAESLGISVADYMAQNPAMYQGAITTLMGGDKRRADEAWASFADTPRSITQILNYETMKAARDIRDKGDPLLDQEFIKTIKGEAGKKYEGEELNAVVQNAIEENSYRPLAYAMGYTDADIKETADGVVYPDNFNKWRQSVVDQLEPGKKFNEIPMQPFLNALATGTYNLPETSEVTQASIEDARNATLENYAKAMQAQEAQYGKPDKDKAERQAIQAEKDARHGGFGSLMGSPRVYQDVPEARPNVTVAPVDPQAEVVPARNVNVNVPALQAMGTPDRQVTEVIPGMATQLGDLSEAVAAQAPDVASQPRQEQLSIADTEATTRLKNAQSDLYEIQIEAAREGDTSQMTADQKFAYEQMGDAYKEYLEMQNEMIMKGSKMSKAEIENWNQSVESMAEQYGMNAVEMSETEGKLFGILPGQKIMMLEGLLTIPGQMGTVGGGSNSYAPGSGKDALENLYKAR